MLTDIPRQIVGVLRAPNGQPFPNATLTWFRERRAVGAQGASVVLDEPVFANVDGSGAINTMMVAGRYLVQVRLRDVERYFAVAVPDQAGPHDISTLIDGPSPDEPDDLTAFQSLVDKAKNWAQAAEDVEVEPGEFSSLHHSQKASEQRALAQQAAINAAADANAQIMPNVQAAHVAAQSAAQDANRAEAARDLAENFAGIDHRATTLAGLPDPAGLTLGETGLVLGSGDDEEDGLYEVQDDSGNVWVRVGASGLAGKLNRSEYEATFDQPIFPGWLHVIREATGAFLAGIRKTGQWEIPHLLVSRVLSIAGARVEPVDAPRLGFAHLKIDGKLIGYIKPDGTVFISHLETKSGGGGGGEIDPEIANRTTQLERDTSGEAVLTRFPAPFTISKRWNVQPKLIVSVVDDDSIDNYANPVANRPYIGGYFSRFRPVFKRFDMPFTEAAIVPRDVNTSDMQIRWRLLRAMQNFYNHEIANHSSTHVRPFNDGISDGFDHYNVDYEWVRSFKALSALGFDIKTAVYPFGQNNEAIRESVRRNHVCGATTSGQGHFNVSPLHTYQIRRFGLDAPGGFTGDYRLPHEDRNLQGWINHIEAMKALVAQGQRVWVVCTTHAFKSEWANWDTTGVPGSAPREDRPTDWGPGESGYNPDWVVCGLRDGGGNLVFPTDEITPSQADSSIPAGWRPQLNTRLHDLWDFLEYLHDEEIEVTTLSRGHELMRNLVDVGDYATMSSGAITLSNPHYVVGRDGTARFRPLDLE